MAEALALDHLDIIIAGAKRRYDKRLHRECPG
jgi:hypothetical protein